MKSLLTAIFLAMPLLISAEESDESIMQNANVIGAETVSEERQEGLLISADALAFFRDNEYDSKLTTGYSLPGVWVRPKVEYNPNRNIHLELGAHALFFDGANKYPNYAYHDIGKWKGNQYQDGAHILPWFRAQADMKNVSVVLGDIYGDLNHGIITPLYNKEQVMSADPEMGAQILVHSKGFKIDAFVNWQSYQFEEDTHQEAFTVGLIGSQKLTRNLSAVLDVLVQHRGGEQDLPELELGVQTICNGAIGLKWASDYDPQAKVINGYNASINLLGCYQQAGHLWPFDSGIAIHAEAGVDIIKQLSACIGYVYAPKEFISVYGNPFFSTMNYSNAGIRYNGMQTSYLSFDYHHTFGEHYTLGAMLETFSPHADGLNEFNFSFGLYLRVNPSWKL